MKLTITPQQFEQIRRAADLAARTIDNSFDEEVWRRGLIDIFGAERVREMDGQEVEVVVDWQESTEADGFFVGNVLLTQ